MLSRAEKKRVLQRMKDFTGFQSGMDCPKTSNVSFQWPWVGGILGLSCCNWAEIVALFGYSYSDSPFAGSHSFHTAAPWVGLGKVGLLALALQCWLVSAGHNGVGNGNQLEIKRVLRFTFWRPDKFFSCLPEQNKRKIKKRVILVWLSWFGLVCVLTQGQGDARPECCLLGRLAQEMHCLASKGSDESASKQGSGS